MSKSWRDLGLAKVPYIGQTTVDDFPVEGLSLDSRKVRPGWLFAAVEGEESHGVDHIEQAIAGGAIAILTSLSGAARLANKLNGLSVPVHIHANPRRLFAQLAASFFAEQPGVVAAITGTDGKSSCANFTAQIWRSSGLKAGYLGTTGMVGPSISRSISLTTPEPESLHQSLQQLHKSGATHLALEASSHGLAQERLDGVKISAGAFLNIGRDHLDYHKDFADYLSAKSRLFDSLLPEGKVAVLNADINEYEFLHAICHMRAHHIIPFGKGSKAKSGWRLLERSDEDSGQRLLIEHKGKKYGVHLPLIGAFQADNALAALAIASATGVAADAGVAALENLVGVRGRMQLVGRRKNGARIFVDYAHTPNALATALAAARSCVEDGGKLVVLFGAGGDRDKGKRKQMGQIAAQAADKIVVTDDNPRFEEPAQIRAAIISGFTGSTQYIEIGDRKRAISESAEKISEGDVLLIAGKGHETGQSVAGKLLPFDDVEHARASLHAIDGANCEIAPDAELDW